ncbi:MAG: tail fiber domain-containing protein, partial [Candidatus Marinimicrobia bacterium]|nr:tail fiber domain-containing protein [Candidatus Neomarinimicrobiota bacterium]
TGDASIKFGNYGGQTYYTGIDQSDGNAFKITGLNDWLAIDNTGNVTIGGPSWVGNTNLTVKARTHAQGYATDPMFTLDQLGNTNDVSMRLIKSGGQTWLMGIDATDLDKFKISNSAFDHTGDTDQLVITSTGDVGIGLRAPAYKLDVNGLVAGTDAFVIKSDIRLKKNVVTLENALNKVLHMRGVAYEWRRDEFSDINFVDGRRIGLIAQELEEVYPEFVSTGSDGYKSVAYAPLTAVLIEAVKELNAENAALKAQMAQFESTLQQLVALTASLESGDAGGTTIAQVTP